jgi:apolipoprotein D and lipocalin family protein
MKTVLVVLAAFLLSGCLGMPEKVTPVSGFELDRYLGKWYEVARLDHSFERGLENVSAEYALRDDGGVSVINRGYSPEKGEWKEATGKAYFVNDSSEGYLKVSFFGPFYGSYVVFELDKTNYEHAFISGPDTSYLWLLARRPDVGPEVIERFRQQAQARGFDLSGLIFVKHAQMTPPVDN